MEILKAAVNRRSPGADLQWEGSDASSGLKSLIRLEPYD